MRLVSSRVLFEPRSEALKVSITFLVLGLRLSLGVELKRRVALDIKAFNLIGGGINISDDKIGIAEFDSRCATIATHRLLVMLG